MYKSTGSPSTPKCWFPIKNPHWYGHFGSFRRFNQVGFWGLWSLMIRQFCHLRSQNDNLSYLQFQQSPGIPLFQRYIFLLLPFIMIVHLDSSLLLFWHLFLQPCKKRSHLHGVLAGPLPGIFWGRGGRDLWRRVWHLEKFIPVWECFFFENWRVTHQMQPLDRFGDVQWCLTGNRIVGVKWDTLHFHMIHHTKAFFQTQSMAMNSKMPRWQWLKSCFVCRMKVAGATNAAHHVEKFSPPCFSTKVFYTSLFGMLFQLSINQDGWKMLSFHFCMKSLNYWNTLSSIWEPLMIFKEAFSLHSYHLPKFTQMQDWIIDCCDLGAHLLQSPGWAGWNPRFYVISLVGKLWKKGGIASHGESILAADQGFPDIAFLFSSHEALYECLGGQKFVFWKVKTMFFGDFQVFQKQGLKPFLFSSPTRRPEASQMVGRCIPVWGPTAVGPTLPWGLSFWDKMRYII